MGLNRHAAFVVMVLCWAVSACGGASARDKALRTAFVATQAAKEGYLAWETHRVDEIAKMEPIEAAKAAAMEHRRRSAVVMEAFSVAYQTLAAAALDPSQEMIIQAAKAALAVRDLVTALKGGGP